MPSKNCRNRFVQFSAHFILFGIILLSIEHNSFGENYVEKCRQSDNDGTTNPFDSAGNFRPECAPDTLYAWMTPDKILKRAQNSTPENVLPFKGRLFSWRTPVGSYGYGESSMRIKLRPGVKFKKIPMFSNDDWYSEPRNCDTLNKLPEARNTVFVADGLAGGYHEYILCNSGPVHSWSYGTPEHFNEQQSEKNWMRTHSEQEYDHLIQKQLYISRKDWPCYWDGHDWSFEVLTERVQSMLAQVIKLNGGNIFYSSDVEKSRKDHFSTKVKTYWSTAALSNTEDQTKSKDQPE